MAKTIEAAQRTRDKHERAKLNIEQLHEQLEQARRIADDLTLKLTRESDQHRLTRQSHKAKLSQLESENIRLKGVSRSMTK